MKNTLLIHFCPNGQVNWARFDKRQQLIDHATQVEFTTISRANEQVVVLVPSTAVLLTQAIVPSKQMRRIRQAVPYALEEQVAADIEELHFALADKPIAGHMATAVVASSEMEHWLATLAECDLHPTLLLPDVLAVPLPAEGWGLLVTDAQGLVRTGHYSGFAIELDNLILALQLTMQNESAPPPTALTLYQSTEAATPTVLTALHGLGIPIRTETHPLGTWHWFQTGLAVAKPLNLLQAAYQPVRSTRRGGWRPWGLTAGLLLGLSVMLIIQQWLEYRALQAQRTALNTEIRQIYQAAFPATRRIVNPRVQMQQQLNTLRQQATQGTETVNFLSLLTQISPVLQQTPNLKIKRLDYRNEQFDLSVTLANLQTLEQLQQQLTAQQFKVTLQNASSRAGQVEARLRISL